MLHEQPSLPEQHRSHSWGDWPDVNADPYETTHQPIHKACHVKPSPVVSLLFCKVLLPENLANTAKQREPETRHPNPKPKRDASRKQHLIQERAHVALPNRLAVHEGLENLQKDWDPVNKEK